MGHAVQLGEVQNIALNAFKDLGVVLSPELKHHDQVDAAVKKARNTNFVIRHVFRDASPKVLLRFYTALVRQVLECCIQVWTATTLGDMV